MNLIKQLEWRYATKKFNPDKEISDENIEKLKRAVQLSVSSYGLQLYKVLIIKEKELREQLKPVSWGQQQITDASHLFVFCNYTSVQDTQIEEYLDLTAETRNLKKEEIAGYGDFIKKKLAEKDHHEQTNWLERQPYLALSNLLIACAELGIDACPMEGFEPKEYNNILNLNDKGLNACVIAAVGYRSEKDTSQFQKKIRKPMNELFEVVEYNLKPVASLT